MSVKRAWVLGYALIIIALMVGGVFVRVGDSKLTPARLLGLMLLFWLLLKVLLLHRVYIGGLAGRILLVWLLLSLGVDSFRPEPRILLLHLLNISSGIVWFYIVVNARLRWDSLERAVKLVGLITGIVAILALLARFMAINPGGVTERLVPSVGTGFRLSLLAWEPNIFGAMVAMMLIALVPNLTRGRYAVRSVYATFALLLVALAGALSKGPWLAFAVGLAVYGLIVPSGRAAKRVFFLIGIGALVSVVFVTTAPSQTLGTVVRAHNFVVRFTEIQVSLQAVAIHPVLGNGTFSLSVLDPELTRRFGGSGVWVGQTAVGVISDTGVLGLLLFTSCLVVLLRRAVIAIRRNYRQEAWSHAAALASAAVGMAAVLVAMGVATTLYGLPVYWAVMGLVASVPRLLSRRKEEPDSGSD